MTFKFKILFKTGLFALLFFPLPALGQEIGLIRLNPDRPDSQSEAALWGGVEQGRFRSVDMPLFQWSAGARVKGASHGKRTSWLGLLSFEQASGKDVFSSLLLEPGYFPVDILESTRGAISRQTVRLSGGVVTDFGNDWAAGIMLSGKGMHSIKRADVRHSDWGLEIQAEPTVTYVMDGDMGFAVAGIFRLRTETLKADLSGSQPIFVDEGLRYVTTPSGNGVFSFLEPALGFAAQYYDPEFTLKVSDVWKRGTVKGWFRYPGSTFSASFERTLEGFTVNHVYGLSYSRMRDQLRRAAIENGEGSSAYSDRVFRALEMKYEARFLQGHVKKFGIVLDGRRWVERSLAPIWDLTKRNFGTAALSSSFTFGPVDLTLEAFAGGGLWRDRGRSRDEVEDTES